MHAPKLENLAADDYWSERMIGILGHRRLKGFKKLPAFLLMQSASPRGQKNGTFYPANNISMHLLTEIITIVKKGLATWWRKGTQ